jgi:hypothetical protein
MKSKLISIIFTAALLSLAEACFAQGFVNLNFESASLVPVPGDIYNRVQFAQAFPGWTGTVGGVQQTLALYDGVFLDSAGISIIDHNWTPYIPSSLGLIQGNYTAILQSGLTLASNPQPADTTLSQTALIPIGTQSLLFKAHADVYSYFIVTLGGQTLSLTPLSTGTNYTLYGANVSSWAGQTAQLAFTVLAQNPHIYDEYVSLDAIQFSTQSIPEPSAFALAALGALFLGFSRRKSRLR